MVSFPIVRSVPNYNAQNVDLPTILTKDKKSEPDRATQSGSVRKASRPHSHLSFGETILYIFLELSRQFYRFGKYLEAMRVRYGYAAAKMLYPKPTLIDLLDVEDDRCREIPWCGSLYKIECLPWGDDLFRRNRYQYFRVSAHREPHQEQSAP